MKEWQPTTIKPQYRERIIAIGDGIAVMGKYDTDVVWSNGSHSNHKFLIACDGEIYQDGSAKFDWSMFCLWTPCPDLKWYEG